VKDFLPLIPLELRDFPRTKVREHPERGLAYYLWHILQWAGDDRSRQDNVGCGWRTENEFFLDKVRFCDLFQIRINTLNFKLRRLGGFRQTDVKKGTRTFWTCAGFSPNATAGVLEEIDRHRNVDRNAQRVTLLALFLPTLEDIRLFTSLPHEVARFRTEALTIWTDLVGEGIWAIPFDEFVGKAVDHFCQSLSGSLGGLTEVERTEFSEYLLANRLDLRLTAYSMIAHVMTHDNPRLLQITDFHKFLARFGPEDCVLEKIHQLLCCSQAFGGWFQPGEQQFDQTKQMTGSYSNTYANCFVIRRAQGHTYHIYNLANASTTTSYLQDEVGKKFLTWHNVFESFTAVVQPQPFYPGFYQDEF
jgi:hypothetical protein